MAAVEAPGAMAAPAGPGTSVAEAYAAYARELQTYVVTRFGSRMVPEDVVHEAFARLVRETAAGREPVFVRAWLYRVAHNLVVSELRRPLAIEPAAEHDERSPSGCARSAEAEHEARSLSPEIREALDALSSDARTAILMSADGYSGREIAAAVGRSELATRALLCRARRLLRAILATAGPATDWGLAPRVAAPASRLAA
jgi:RNA polymerase sigma-70 factor (ECF subfamily)